MCLLSLPAPESWITAVCRSKNEACCAFFIRFPPSFLLTQWFHFSASQLVCWRFDVEFECFLAKWASWESYGWAAFALIAVMNHRPGVMYGPICQGMQTASPLLSLAAVSELKWSHPFSAEKEPKMSAGAREPERRLIINVVHLRASPTCLPYGCMLVGKSTHLPQLFMWGMSCVCCDFSSCWRSSGKCSKQLNIRDGSTSVFLLTFFFFFSLSLRPHGCNACDWFFVNAKAHRMNL